MLELRSPDFLSTDFLVHRKGKSFAVWPADVDDQDDPIKVLINAETAIDSGRIKTAMEKHREIIEQLARDSYRKGVLGQTFQPEAIGESRSASAHTSIAPEI